MSDPFKPRLLTVMVHTSTKDTAVTYLEYEPDRFRMVGTDVVQQTAPIDPAVLALTNPVAVKMPDLTPADPGSFLSWSQVYHGLDQNPPKMPGG